MLHILSGRFEIGSPEVVVMFKLPKTFTTPIFTVEDFEKALITACTEYLLSPAGKGALQGAGTDFNVGDLSCWMEHPPFQEILSRHGLGAMEIHSFDDVWDYDKHLCNSMEIEEALDEEE